MIRRFAVVILAVAAVACVAAPAQAGGSGGTKRTVSVRTFNNWGTEVVVFGLSQAQANAGTVPTTVTQAKSRYGGVVIANGGTKTVRVPGGSGVLAAAEFDATTGVLSTTNNADAAYTLSNGSSTTAEVLSNAGTMEVQIPAP